MLLVAVLGPLLTSPSTLAQDRVTDRPAPLVVEFLDVGQGDSILIRSPEGKTALIDSGPSKDVVPLLRRRGVTSIDLVVVSHHHVDHYDGMDDVIRSFKPRFFMSSESSHTTPMYLKLLTQVRDDGLTAIFPTNQIRRIELGSVMLDVLPQPPEDLRDENDNSIGIRLRYGSFSALLTGDSQATERAYWEGVVPHLVRDCTVLKLAHHGSRNGLDARWLDLTRPKLAVACLGASNEYGHPHPETLSLLGKHEVPLLRTDRDGSIEIVSDGKSWKMSGVRPMVRRPPQRDDQAAPARNGKEAAGKRTRLIDVNSASLQELESLPGIGPTIARRIVVGRPYRSGNDLLGIKGIGAKRLAELRPLITVD